LSADLDPPQKIYFISPGFIHEESRLAQQYYFRVPRDQKPGVLTIIVRVQWPGGSQDQDGYAISQSFSVMVRDPEVPCADSCTKNRSKNL